ncbi:MAG: DUF4037 domain-containing protein [Spirochaetales bacterium]|uniref:DUF4037 domain-containing protein n=1 Tax=Candidatus Thalassospirochaeta sargassi TaxID=3119039 RepID=A0AAJ1IL33_9SPIO|nr:DUF4037 domain-containing protein [Spirochaetales bacterium]
MKHKVQRISKDLAERLSKWEQVDAITILESAEEDYLSPYFFISLDVYYKGDIPEKDTRQALFSDAGAFESSSYGKKDRFFIEDVPIHLEFKNLDRINTIIELKTDNFGAFRATGTYMFYRLLTGKVLIQKNLWLDHIRKKLTQLPDEFWQMLATASLATLEHYLIDLQSAAMENDDYFFMVSQSGFLKTYCSLLFTINHEFEPSRRNIIEKLDKLPTLPEHFLGRMQSLINVDGEMTNERKADVAELMAKSIIPFVKVDY